mgnify:CR=1 FL=1
MTEQDIHTYYRQAGQIAAQAREYGLSLLKAGALYKDIAEKVEEKIVSLGGQVAFPVNIAANHIAAHYSPTHDDTTTVQKGDLIKLDVGAHINGYIGDTAATVEIETTNHTDMIQASTEALQAALELITPGIDLHLIGKAIEDTITSYGYKPIENLTGHSLKQYTLHAGLSIPNTPRAADNSRPQEGDIIAIEPFATDGGGRVTSGAGSNIYCCQDSLRSRFIRDNRTKKAFQSLYRTYKTLPFSERAAHKTIPSSSLNLKRLSMYGVLHHYPQLPEINNGLVTQKEHTVIITADGCSITTNP